MNIIKVRQWNPKTKKMYYGFGMRLDNQWRNYPTMLWIGRQDNNGKDIYMGDIIYDSLINLKGDVRYDNEQAMFYYCVNNKQLGFFGFSGIILGNIYEHPQLLCFI